MDSDALMPVPELLETVRDANFGKIRLELERIRKRDTKLYDKLVKFFIKVKSNRDATT